ncbi:hypothetical protein Vi05172_g7499 [Venturia inaequalis]|nr:hypothetical protein Vi05172_g7499 [Venturia inaequalis]
MSKCTRQPISPYGYPKISNACGLYAILHAVANSEAKQLSDMPVWYLKVKEVVRYLEESEELKQSYHAVALQESTHPSPNAENEVDYHSLCFA